MFRPRCEPGFPGQLLADENVKGTALAQAMTRGRTLPNPTLDMDKAYIPYEVEIPGIDAAVASVEGFTPPQEVTA